ncbi:MAG: NAD(P)-dependent oxidoreductase [Opitutales bacterium]
MSNNVGWIGTGVMGQPMAGHLLKAGYQVRVYNRTKDKAATLLEQGAEWRESPGEAAEGCDFVFVIVGFPSDVESVFLGESGILTKAKTGAVLIDMTTSDPALAERIHAEATAREMSALDAPVSGGDLGARNASLAIMVGGEQGAFDAALPLFRVMGENIAYFGPAGSGQRVKMSNQILIASTMIGVVESMLYATRAGLSMDAVIDLIGQGAAGCWSINNLGRRIAKQDFDPGFFIKHFVKDMGIALHDASQLGLDLPGLAMAKEFYDKAMVSGLENDGTQALFKIFADMNEPSG